MGVWFLILSSWEDEEYEGDKEKGCISRDYDDWYLLFIAEGQEQRGFQDVMLNVYIKAGLTGECQTVPLAILNEDQLGLELNEH